MSSLLIVESPAKCSKIQGFLGPGWKVIATMGHIRALEQDLAAVGLDRDFEPRYEFLKEKGKAIAAIRAAAAAASTVYLASDDDREGEAISYSVAALLKLDPATTPRAVFHEITAPAVRAAVAAPRRLDMNRVHAQQARAILDMMVGFTISPLLWKYVGQALSAGRCQTPALRLLADREKEIRDFAAETTWRVGGNWTSVANGVGGTATFPAEMVEPLEDRESAENYLENLHDDTGGRVIEAETRPTSESPPRPLITSTLQQEASALYGSQPKNTMRIAQRLYEAGHITYMRTDSAVLSEEARAEAEAFVRQKYGDAYVGLAAGAAEVAAKGKKKKAKEGAAPPAQEAHEAIRPTHVTTVDLPADEDWNATDRKIYRLIWNRAVQSVMAPARGEARTVVFRANGDPGEFDWRATWRRQLFAGWRAIGAAATNLDSEDELAETAEKAAKDSWAVGTALSVGTTLSWSTLTAAPQTSKAPGRFTEATLVRELERQGIGRPSTFAALVGTIIDKQYADKRDTPAKEVKQERLTIGPNQWPPTVLVETKKTGAEKQKLAPTPLGLSTLEFCLREFPDLFAYEFTAQMERRLDAIATGVEPWKSLCRETWGSYKDKYETLKKGQGSVAAASRQRLFSNGIKAVQSKKGPLLLREGATKEATVFFGWPTDKAFQELTDEEATAFVSSKESENAGATLGAHEGYALIKKAGKFGPYVEWNGQRAPWKEGDTVESIVERLQSKSVSLLHTLGPFEFRKGPYGVYMVKKDLAPAARKFVGLPSGVDPKSLTQEAAVKIYQTGLAQKARGAAYKKKG